jgi:uncharacterized protein (TIGR00251 family)
MKLTESKDGVIIEINVKPSSKQFKILVESEALVVFCREAPVKGKVNRELMKELSKVFKEKVEIVAGFTSREKKILIRNVSSVKVNEILSVHRQESPSKYY